MTPLSISISIFSKMSLSISISISIFSKISLSILISISIFSKISLSISISISIFSRMSLSISISIFSKISLSISISISIFFKSVDISTIDIRYRYIEQGYHLVPRPRWLRCWLAKEPLIWSKHCHLVHNSPTTCDMLLRKFWKNLQWSIVNFDKLKLIVVVL